MKKMYKIEPINTSDDGTAKTLMTHYHKEGIRNFLTALWGGQMDGHVATAVMEIYEEE